MMSIDTLLAVADAYKCAASVSSDATVSGRVFGDSKKLTAMRRGADITVSRFQAAMRWFATNWPPGHDLPEVLRAVRGEGKCLESEDAA